MLTSTEILWWHSLTQRCSSDEIRSCVILPSMKKKICLKICLRFFLRRQSKINNADCMNSGFLSSEEMSGQWKTWNLKKKEQNDCRRKLVSLQTTTIIWAEQTSGYLASFVLFEMLRSEFTLQMIVAFDPHAVIFSISFNAESKTAEPDQNASFFLSFFLIYKAINKCWCALFFASHFPCISA